MLIHWNSVRAYCTPQRLQNQNNVLCTMFFKWKITTLSHTIIYISFFRIEFHSLKTWELSFDFEKIASRKDWCCSCKTNLKPKFVFRKIPFCEKPRRQFLKKAKMKLKMVNLVGKKNIFSLVFGFEKWKNQLVHHSRYS